jgi:hypothetical protein
MFDGSIAALPLHPENASKIDPSRSSMSPEVEGSPENSGSVLKRITTIAVVVVVDVEPTKHFLDQIQRRERRVPQAPPAVKEVAQRRLEGVAGFAIINRLHIDPHPVRRIVNPSW